MVIGPWRVWAYQSWVCCQRFLWTHHKLRAEFTRGDGSCLWCLHQRLNWWVVLMWWRRLGLKNHRCVSSLIIICRTWSTVVDAIKWWNSWNWWRGPDYRMVWSLRARNTTNCLSPLVVRSSSTVALVSLIIRLSHVLILIKVCTGSNGLSFTEHIWLSADEFCW